MERNATGNQAIPHAIEVAIIVTAFVIGVIRPILAPHPVSLQGSYEAMAHLFVGGIFGAWLVTRARLLLFVVIALTIVEVASAVFTSIIQ